MPILSDNYVKSANLPGGRDELIIRDSKLAGFALRLRRKADGKASKTFLVFQELPSRDGTRKRRKIIIGDHSVFPAEKAKAEALAILQAIEKGDDPAAAKAAKKAQPPFEDLVDDFENSHIAAKKPETRKDYRGRIRRNILPYFKGKRVADITGEMVRDFFRRKRSNPTDANRSLAVLSVMMGRAIELGWRKDNPCVGIKKNTETAREDWLDERDLPAFVKALADVEGDCGDLIRYLLVSGWRVSEARLLTWDMVDLPRMVARLPETKSGVSVRALSTDAATLIDRQAHRLGFVFSGRKGSQPVSYKRLREVLHSVCAAAGIDQITPHGLRHTAATWAAVSGAEAHELREAFGWKTLAMTNRYVSKAESLGRRGAQRAADAMNVLQKPKADVKEISR
ncbi:site-specific integrase [Mesorhizobium sp. M2E.F.Ca.ET.209.01.1.1]|uniref:tyrosine-type recombinase/integrase n=1 Tax=Mesorhizobium sp. M2E.F.Ca.ET.209.01.1.1 TaxID=2500526 RepID=UPI000FD6C3A7|nr:site-specific integrase [Mesorhizobium sp. M2E.F.Ca.ET.209.01.1.1]TGS17262.1 site-specific integrase [Mesorhizobium sp. M2E.F.Ca.ET.209.01.1.1]